ncbi:MAG: hypothetical protein Q7J67_06500 [bacterium]|nr:hypothetical protein [bacterium]
MNNESLSASSEPQETPQTKELMGIGELLKISWSVIKNNIVILLGIAALYLVGCLTAISKAFTFPVIIIDWVTSIGLTFAINNILEGRTANIKESYKAGLEKIFPYAWVSILVFLSTFGGFLLLIIPGIIFFIWFGFAPYVCIIEEIGSTGALKRSKQLVKGNWWYVLKALLVCAIVYGICICIPFGLLYAILGSALKVQVLRIAGGLAMIASTAVYVLMFRNLRDIKG